MNSPRQFRAPLHRAFTLPEMLIAVAIMAVVASLLFPAMRAIRERAGGVACLGQLRQVGLAFQMFGNENRGFFPTTLYDEVTKSETSWESRVGPYLNVSFSKLQTLPEALARKSSPFLCPSEREPKKPWSTYAMNKFLYQRLYGDKAFLRPAQLPRPSALAVLADAYGKSMIYCDDRRKMIEWSGLDRRHNSVPNFLYADWHAEPFTRELLGFTDTSNPFYQALWRPDYVSP